jgi:hypothetical protein
MMLGMQILALGQARKCGVVCPFVLFLWAIVLSVRILITPLVSSNSSSYTKKKKVKDNV